MTSRPDRRLVEDVLASVSRRTGLTPGDILSSKRADARRARIRAWRIIQRATGCTSTGLAEVWGSPRQTVAAGLAERIQRAAPLTLARSTALDAALDQYVASIRFHYPERAEAILAGRDPATQADVAAWKRLGECGQPHTPKVRAQ